MPGRKVRMETSKIKEGLKWDDKQDNDFQESGPVNQ